MMQKHAKQKGFTIVELLIVIVVIGILVAITIVAFNGIQNRATDTTIQSDLRSIGSLIGQQQAINGSYPLTLTAAMGIKVTRSAYSTTVNNLYYCANSTGTQYTISARGKNGSQFAYRSDGGPVAVTFGWSGANSCTDAGLLTTDFRQAGHDFTGGTGWAAWVNP